jgi:hypothetical protein
MKVRIILITKKRYESKKTITNYDINCFCYQVHKKKDKEAEAVKSRDRTKD